MAVPVLEAIADAIMRFEGWEPSSLSYRNRNPGNLRESSITEVHDDKGYLVFEDFESGYHALLLDLYDKVTGLDRYKLNAHSSLLEFFQVYAPSADHNHPQVYASFVADWLCRVYAQGDIYSSWSFWDIFAAVVHEQPSGKPAR